MATHRIHVIDSHTGGEPTRLITRGGPDLGDGTLAERVKIFREKHDAFRSAVVNEPRGSDVMVGALLTEPHDKSCQFGVIFFNNVGYLGMCGHGTIGLVVTLAHMGRIAPGSVRIDTPVGPVDATLNADGSVTLDNVPAYRHAKAVPVEVPGYGKVEGDIAWGGNWFFLIEKHAFEVNLANAGKLTAFTTAVKDALLANKIFGADGGEIDHIEVFAKTPTADSRNFVLCPGAAYDRSPCGTGTSAKLACLAADGKLAEGAFWKQESVIGSVFTGSYKRLDADRIRPTITGTAYVNAESVQIVNPEDPFAWGIR
jgi:4-hydroxyproline epimerase